MDNIKKIFNDKNIKIIIPVIVLVVLMIVIFVYLGINKYNNYRDKQEYNIYQYFAGKRFDYESVVSFDRNKVIKDFEIKKYNVIYDSVPFYVNEKDTDMVIFSDRMSIIFPLKTQRQYKIPEFSYIKKINDIHYLTFEKYNKNLDHYVLYDGGNLYFFSDSINFKVNGKEVTLSPFSYLVSSQSELKYYNYEKDEFTTIEISEPLIVSSEYYTINVTNDTLDYKDNKLLLTNDFDNFQNLGE